MIELVINGLLIILLLAVTCYFAVATRVEPSKGGGENQPDAEKAESCCSGK